MNGWYVLYQLLGIYSLIVLARVLMSWFVGPGRRNPVYEMLERLTDPVLEPVRRVLPAAGGFDFSPIVVILLLSFLRQVVGSMAYGGF